MPDTPYCPLPNQFRQAMRARQRLIGCWSSLGTTITTEILGTAGYDWLLLDSEHTPVEVGDLVLQLMALSTSRSAPVVRPPANDPVMIKRLLDAGFFNFLLPFVESAEDAERAVASTRYPPRGIRGVSASHRSNRFGTVPDYFATVDENICVMVQIETPQAVTQAAAIAAVEGVDGVFVGPSDLSAAMGHIGQPNHPEVQAAIAGVFEQVRLQGKGIGILAPAEADARRYLDMGATFVAVGLDQGLFRQAVQARRDAFMKTV